MQYSAYDLSPVDARARSWTFSLKLILARAPVAARNPSPHDHVFSFAWVTRCGIWSQIPVTILDYCSAPVLAIELESTFRQATQVRSSQELHLDDNIQAHLMC
jgi:hypothetical protein